MLSNSEDTMHKRQHGQYFTTTNPFQHPAFQAWATRAGLPGATVLEPFAGANHIIQMLAESGYSGPSVSYDLDPKAEGVAVRDTLADFPQGHTVVVTNPPWLARNSAVRRGLDFPPTRYEDLYQYALSVCLTHVAFVAAIIPESFMQAGILLDRCTALISLPQKMFEDTEHPVCLAVFEPVPVAKSTPAPSTVLGHPGDPSVWSGAVSLGVLSHLRHFLPRPTGIPAMQFNAPQGTVAIYAVDSQIQPTIRFVAGELVDSASIKHSSRAITRVHIPALDPADRPALLAAANAELARIRHDTSDVFLTSFKGLRRDGQYRRRLDFALARTILEHAWATLPSTHTHARPPIHIP